MLHATHTPDGDPVAPFPSPNLTTDQWDTLTTYLITRSGGYCEARTPACLTSDGNMRGLTDRQRSRHHRRARKMGGTDLPDVHSLANLTHICGSGTTGCHGFIEHHPELALAAGWLVPAAVPGRPTPATDPAQVPLVLATGWKVLLHPLFPVKPKVVGFTDPPFRSAAA